MSYLRRRGLRRKSPRVLVFDVIRLSARSRGSVGERPLHTRKVAGSIPAGTTTMSLLVRRVTVNLGRLS
jgi:hypothetical protein